MFRWEGYNILKQIRKRALPENEKDLYHYLINYKVCIIPTERLRHVYQPINWNAILKGQSSNLWGVKSQINFHNSKLLNYMTASPHTLMIHCQMDLPINYRVHAIIANPNADTTVQLFTLTQALWGDAKNRITLLTLIRKFIFLKVIIMLVTCFIFYTLNITFRVKIGIRVNHDF